MKLISLHWTLHPEKNEGCYILEGSGVKRACTWQEAYEAFLRGEKVGSPWYDKEVERRLGDGTTRQAISQELDIDYVASGALAFDEQKMKAGFHSSTDSAERWEVDVDLWLGDDASVKGQYPTGKGWLLSHIKDAFLPATEGRIWIWEKPQEKHPYCLFADPAESLTGESDQSAFAVVDTITSNVVATGMGRWPPEEFCFVLCAIGYEYNEAFLAVENNAVGMSVLMALTGRIAIKKDEQNNSRLRNIWLYDRLYCDWNTDTIKQKHTQRLGWRTDKVGKRELVTIQRRYMLYRTDYCRDKRYWLQCMGFVELPNGKMENPSGDDLVIAVGGALRLAPEAALYPPVSKTLNVPKRDYIKELLDAANADDADERLSKLIKVEVKVP